jgi:tetratricopeptide (TPR) repeat protein
VLGIPRASSEAQVKEAYFRLAKRFHPDTHHDPHLADLRDKLEAVFIRQEKFWDAIQLLENAIPAARSRMKQKGRVLLARSYLRNPNWVKQAEQVLLAATQEDATYAEPFFVLGTIYKASGLRSRAVSMFRKAVELKPEHEEAAAELLALAPEPPPAEEAEESPPSGGLLKKLFRRERPD